MAESKQDRARAAKIRALKKPTPEQARWLAGYNARVSASRTKRAVRMSDAAPSMPNHAESLLETAGARAERPVVGQSDTRTDAPPPSVVVHETAPVEGSVSPDAATWEPVVPPVVEGADAPPPGAPPPAAAGLPLVDDAPPGAPPAPTGDPAAAAQFAAFVMLVTSAGYAAALELSQDWPLPPDLRMLASADQTRATAIQGVGAAASRVAIKYGFRSVPMADEMVVGGAVAGSLLAVVAVQRKKAGKGKKRAPASADVAASPDVAETSAASPAPEVVDLPPHIAQAFAGQS